MRSSCSGRGTAGFVDHHVLARVHRRDGQSCAVLRDGGDHHKLHVRTVEKAAIVGSTGHIRKSFHEPGLGFGGPVRPPTHAGPTRSDQVFRHAKGVAVVDTDDSEFEAHGASGLL
jgi:hypothetical protein